MATAATFVSQMKINEALDATLCTRIIMDVTLYIYICMYSKIGQLDHDIFSF